MVSPGDALRKNNSFEDGDVWDIKKFANSTLVLAYAIDRLLKQ